MDENTAPQRESEERKRKKREAAAASRNEKRQRMGEAAFLQEKRDAEKEGGHMKAT